MFSYQTEIRNCDKKQPYLAIIHRGFAMRSYKKNENEFSWGCEFVEDGSYGSLGNLTEIDRVLYLPLKIIQKTLDTKYIAEIIFKDKDYINELAYSIKMNGIFEPGKLTYDEHSVRLSDGNHRFLAAEIIGLKKFPVRVVKVDNLKARSVRFADLFTEILESLWQEK